MKDLKLLLLYTKQKDFTGKPLFAYLYDMEKVLNSAVSIKSLQSTRSNNNTESGLSSKIQTMYHIHQRKRKKEIFTCNYLTRLNKYI